MRYESTELGGCHSDPENVPELVLEGSGVEGSLENLKRIIALAELKS